MEESYCHETHVIPFVKYFCNPYMQTVNELLQVFKVALRIFLWDYLTVTGGWYGH